jgi:2-polyprenyl-6-methoxyphenol hydroxylase-like FAD-dependent oxidoreductase
MNLCARLDRQLFKFCATRLEDLEFSVTRTYPMIQDPVDALLIAYISLHVAATRSMAMFVKALRVVQYLAVLTCCCALAQRHSLAVKNTASKESFDPPPSAFFSAKSSDKRCVIVGGGPVGLATAITLSRPPHSYDVIVLEKTEGNTSIAGYNPSRSYLFNVNPRGLVWFNEPENHEALEKLKERGYEPPNGISSFVVVPADPSVSIPPVRQVKISSSVELKASTNYWIPRHQMVGLLQECCAAAKAKVIMGKNVDSLSSLEDGGYRVHCSDGSCYEASLVVAADGIDSSVRSYLQSKDDSFRIKHYRSPSTGLKLKALQFPANFTLTNTDGSTVTTNSTTIYGIRGINKGSRTRLGFGLLPVKDPSKSNNVRPANTIAPHDHQLWQLKTGAECKQWFLRCFPRLPWDRLVDDSEWERYANAESTTFPFCQYSPGSAVTSSDGLKGIVMVGDACKFLL